MVTVDESICIAKPETLKPEPTGAHTGEFSQQAVEVFRSFGVRRHDGRANPGEVGQDGVAAMLRDASAYYRGLTNHLCYLGWGP